MKLLFLSGSLGARSTNGAVLRALRRLAPGDGAEAAPGALPHFNPDLDRASQDGSLVPQPVRDFRSALAEAQGLVVSSPDYAHGVPGALKNALDWVVSSNELERKPVLLLVVAAEKGGRAQASLRETLSVMGARVIDGPALYPQEVRAALGPDGEIASPELLARLRAALDELLASTGWLRTAAPG